MTSHVSDRGRATINGGAGGSPPGTGDRGGKLFPPLTTLHTFFGLNKEGDDNFLLLGDGGGGCTEAVFSVDDAVATVVSVPEGVADFISSTDGRPNGMALEDGLSSSSGPRIVD